jgi:hypothetical protein
LASFELLVGSGFFLASIANQSSATFEYLKTKFVSLRLLLHIFPTITTPSDEEIIVNSQATFVIFLGSHLDIILPPSSRSPANPCLIMSSLSSFENPAPFIISAFWRKSAGEYSPFFQVGFIL